MIIEEKLTGPVTLCRLHPDENSPEYTAQWILTDDGEIKGLMSRDAKLAWVLEFGAWCVAQRRALKFTTAIRSVGRIMKRFNFIEYRRED